MAENVLTVEHLSIAYQGVPAVCRALRNRQTRHDQFLSNI